MTQPTITMLRSDVEWLVEIRDAGRNLFDEDGMIPFDEPHQCGEGGVVLNSVATPQTDAFRELVSRTAPWESDGATEIDMSDAVFCKLRRPHGPHTPKRTGIPCPGNL